MPDALERPSAVPWPPILLFSGVLLGFALDAIIPVGLLGSAMATRICGIVVVIAAVILDASALLTLRRHETTVLPHRGSARLVTTGPFAYSRNPIYLGNILLTIGLALAFAKAWLLVSAAIEVVLVQRLAILPEERHLEARFQDAWRSYRARTHRWIGRPASIKS